MDGNDKFQMSNDKFFYKDIQVKCKPWFIFPRARGAAFFDNIYLRKDLFQDFKQGELTPEILSVLEHEKKHIERFKKKGYLKYGVSYWVNPRVRFREELIAIKEEMIHNEIILGKMLKNVSNVINNMKNT